MATRPTFEDIYMRLATSLAERSTCRRLHVGCAIVSADYRHVYGVGYNGNVRGGPNDCDVHGPEAVGSCGCIHAEANAVISCTALRGLPKVVFCTDLPCVMCAKFLLQLGGVERVLYARDYRIKDALDLFAQHGVSAVQLA
jgi:dCMP deaminase